MRCVCVCSREAFAIHHSERNDRDEFHSFAKSTRFRRNSRNSIDKFNGFNEFFPHVAATIQRVERKNNNHKTSGLKIGRDRPPCAYVPCLPVFSLAHTVNLQKANARLPNDNAHA